jgi:CHAT domain-containing protein
VIPVRTILFLIVLGLGACTGGSGKERGGRVGAFRSSTPKTGPDSLLAVGESLFNAELYDSARAVWTVALRRARAAHDEPGEARALTWLGLAAYRLGDVTEARGLSEEGLSLKIRLGMTAELWRSHHALGLTALSADRNQEAARHFDEALRTAEAAKNEEGIARAAGGQGLAYGALGDLGKARDGHRTERAAARRIDDTRLEGNALLNEAMVDILEGDAPPALARLDTARALYQRTGYATGAEYALGQLATAYELTGEEDRAFAALDSALAIARRLGLKEEEADNLRLIAGLQVRLGDFRQALRSYDSAEVLMRRMGSGANLGSLLRGSARAELRLGNLPRADRKLEEAIRLHEASGEPLERLQDFLLASETGYEHGGMARAEGSLREAAAIAARVDTREARIIVPLAEATLADRARDSRRVLRVLRGAREDMAAGDFGSEWLASSLTARAHARLGRLDSAVVEGRKAVAAVERLRGALASEPLRATFLADRVDVYADLVLALLRLDRPEDAFSVADAARSRGLLEHLSTVRLDAASSPVPKELIEGEALLRRIDALVQRLRETEPRRPRERGGALGSTAAPIAEELAAARGEYEALLIRAAERVPRATAVLGGGMARLGEVQGALAPDELLLEYLVTPDRLLIFAVTQNGLRALHSDLGSGDLFERVRLLRDLWGSPSGDWRRGLPAARALERTLIGPVREAGLLQGVRQLIVVPHGILGQIPFAALQDEPTGRFLAEDHGVLYLPSAAALPVLRARQGLARPALAAGTGFAPFPDELPATGHEIDLLRAAVPQVALRRGISATEAAVRRALGAEGLVHVATHGVLNVRNPMFSRIELARSRAASPEDDGRLEVHELLGLTIRSHLVFFSGCETAAGQEWGDDPVRGTGDLTLAQAVLAAGAANVIMTLWRIDDAGAAEFAGYFYRNLRSMSVLEAFAGAQRQMAADTRFGSPYYWAGYTLSGAGQLRAQAQDTEGQSVPVLGRALGPVR